MVQHPKLLPLFSIGNLLMKITRIWEKESTTLVTGLLLTFLLGQPLKEVSRSTSVSKSTPSETSHGIMNYAYQQ